MVGTKPMLALNNYGPRSAYSDSIHAEKYRGKGESFREAITRMANALSDNEAHFRFLRDIFGNMRFMPAGRIQAAVGSLKHTTPYNCFVSGTIEDSFIDGQGSIMARATQAAATMRMGGGIGYDFSTLRPNGALIKKLESNSNGPLGFMGIFNEICKVTSSAGNRRGAQMGVLRIDHPDIEAFIRSKQNTDKLTGFNISVAVTNEFMEAMVAGKEFQLRFGGQNYQTVDARNLWEMLMRSTYDWAEPGVLFIDNINDMNNLWYCEKIAATNPCGEQPLPPYGACLLGSINLVKYLFKEGPNGKWTFSFEQLALDMPHVVRAMDNVVDRAKYPLYEQEQEAISKRRMGIGVTGLANTIEALGYPYGSDGFINYMSTILRTIRDEAYKASVTLAIEKGPFPAFNKEKYCDGEFIGTLPADILSSIRTNGIRNSHLLSIAPTGTISLAADNVSSGIEPVFAYEVNRTVIRTDGPEQVVVRDYGVEYLNHKGKIASECTIDDHLRVLTTASKYVDSAVSKTCNVPSDINWEDFKSIYIRAWEAGCKGCTTYRSGGLREGILNVSNSDGATPEELACTVDPESGRRSCE